MDHLVLNHDVLNVVNGLICGCGVYSCITRSRTERIAMRMAVACLTPVLAVTSPGWDAGFWAVLSVLWARLVARDIRN